MIGVIVNPNALAIRKNPGIAARLRQIVGSLGQVVETRTGEELSAALLTFKRAGSDLVAIAGGDGTNLSTLTSLVRTFGAELPALAILRGGTVNTIANNLGIVGSVEQILARICQYRREQRELPTLGQDSICVEIPGENG